MLVLLDRDGVINEDLPTGVLSPDELRFLPGSIEAIASLQKAGFTIAVITNQSAIGRGLLTTEALTGFHRTIDLAITSQGGEALRYYVCPDHPDQPTYRRKPAPGMLLEALGDYAASPSKTPYVGDALRDMEAAHAASCPRYLVTTGQGWRTQADGWPALLAPITVTADLAEAATLIIRKLGR